MGQEVAGDGFGASSGDLSVFSVACALFDVLSVFQMDLSAARRTNTALDEAVSVFGQVSRAVAQSGAWELCRECPREGLRALFC